MEAPENAYTVILAGGGGTRLWPKSRKAHPKHLLKLIGDKTLLRLTYERVKDIFPAERILVITHVDHEKLVRKEVPELPSENIICEPQAKNTALAMGVAAAFVHKRNPNAGIIYLAADHIFKDVPRFQQNAIGALRVALSGNHIVSIGIKPDFPHTGLGYIRIGEELEQESKTSQKGFVFKVDEFKEKPNLVTAQSFVASGQYLWNANLYCWSTQTIFEAFKKHSPKMGEGIKDILDALGTPSQQKTIEKVYEDAENISIDYAISERADNIVVIPGDFGWSDIGDWKVVYDTLDKDVNENALVGDPQSLINIDSKTSMIETNGRLVVTIGLEDIVVVDTEDAILICAKDRTQDVKKVVEKLKEDKKEKYL